MPDRWKETSPASVWAVSSPATTPVCEGVNVTGTWRCYQAAVPLMAKNGYGRIINISSQAARQGGTVYGLTKHTVEHITKGMAREVGRAAQLHRGVDWPPGSVEPTGALVV